MMLAMSDYPECETLLLRRQGWRLEVTLNRPETRNALTHQMMREIGAVVDRVADDETVRALVLRGAGGHFSAGGDVNFMTDLPPPPAPGQVDPLVEPYRYFGDVLVKLNHLPQAVIAVVEGNAVGGGFGMVCCSDVVIVLEKATFGIPEARLGFIPSQIIPFIVRRAGSATIRRLAVTAQRLSGREALAHGIAHYCCETPEQAEAILNDVLVEIGQCEPSAIATVKRLVLAAEDTPVDAVLDDAAQSLVDLLRTSEAREGMAAFLEKRPPPWANST